MARENPPDLIVTLDDDGAIYSFSSRGGHGLDLRALKEFSAGYRAPHYFRTTKAGEIDRDHLTQVGRRFPGGSVEHIRRFLAARRGGRSERTFGTQRRIVWSRETGSPA